MSALSSLARLEAVQAGIAQPLATVRHVHVSDMPLVLIPLKLAGEAAAQHLWAARMAGDADVDTRRRPGGRADRKQRSAVARRVGNQRSVGEDVVEALADLGVVVERKHDRLGQ